MIKECFKHGLTKFKLRTDGRYRCLKCASEAVIKRRKNLIRKAIEYKGGKCELCDYSKCIAALEFHHIDKNTKEFGISTTGVTRSWETIKKELDKCQLLCANCHREVHNIN